MKPAKRDHWELYDLTTDPSEATDLSATHPDVLTKLVALATAAHQPAREGSFTTTVRHERDRRAKFGKQDEPEAPPAKKGKGKGKAKEPTAQAMPTEGIIPNNGWKIIRASSENTGNQKLATNAIDGDVNTWWHSRFGKDAAQPPHELVIDLGTQHRIRGIVLLPRQDAGWNGAIKDIEFSLSTSPDSFPAPAAKATLPKSKAPQTIKCAETPARYLRLRALSEQNGGDLASLAELGVLGE